MTNFFVVTMAAILASTFAVCPPEWTEWKGSCYSFMNQVQMNWADAQAACEGSDGHLVSIGGEEENQWLYGWWVTMLEPLVKGQYTYFWIGYTDQAEEGAWVWSDGALSDFTNWGGGQPDNRGGNINCATMLTKGKLLGGKWDDGNCAAKNAYVCEFEIPEEK